MAFSRVYVVDSQMSEEPWQQVADLLITQINLKKRGNNECDITLDNIIGYEDEVYVSSLTLLILAV